VSTRGGIILFEILKKPIGLDARIICKETRRKQFLKIRAH
jgi:hypothetical protein